MKLTGSAQFHNRRPESRSQTPPNHNLMPTLPEPLASRSTITALEHPLACFERAKPFLFMRNCTIQNLLRTPIPHPHNLIISILRTMIIELLTRPFFNQNGSLLSQRNNLLEETMVTAEQRSPTLSGNITIHSELRSPRLARESIHSELQSPRLKRDVTIQSEHFNNSLHFVKTVPEEDEEAAAEEVLI